MPHEYLQELTSEFEASQGERKAAGYAEVRVVEVRKEQDRGTSPSRP